MKSVGLAVLCASSLVLSVLGGAKYLEGRSEQREEFPEMMNVKKDYSLFQEYCDSDPGLEWRYFSSEMKLVPSASALWFGFLGTVYFGTSSLLNRKDV